MRKFKIAFVVFCLLAVTAGGFAFWLSDKYVVPIMMYHNINYTSQPLDNMVSPENFAWQMSYLKKHGYRILSLDELVNGLREKRSFPRKTVVITFDDGYEDNYQYALPVLKKNLFPAIFFIVTETVEKPGFMSWEQIKEMEKSGMVFGSHTCNHIYLPAVDENQQHYQIQKSKEIIEENLGHPIYYFAYPVGGFTEPIKAMIRQAGYQGACTTNRGYYRLNQNPYELKRIRFGNNDRSDLIMWFKLSGYYNLFRQLKNPN